jgi:hypothetical protein
VKTTRGNLTSILIPTQLLPLNKGLDAEQRPLIDNAYDRPGPTPSSWQHRLASRLGTIELDGLLQVPGQ